MDNKKISLSGILHDLENSRDELIEITQNLVRMPSETPPSDTRQVSHAILEYLPKLDNVKVSFHVKEDPIENVVVVAKANEKGKRLVLSGHLDTYPTGESSGWSDHPFSGAIRDNKIFGRGSADMKGGIACSLVAFNLLAKNPDLWSGELVLALAGDEESMGVLGSQFLLDEVPEVRGDAMLCGDVGSPLVPRIGEKGMIWLDVFATGKPSHGAHIHRGKNAIDMMRKAMDALSELSNHVVTTPPNIANVIKNANSVSEPLGGPGETEVLQKVTVNFGRIAGGLSANLVAEKAELNVDIRLPMGVSVAEIESIIESKLEPIPGIRYDITRRYEPSWTGENDAIVTSVLYGCSSVLGDGNPVVNMRVGASDARLFRAAGIPTVVCGLTPNNLGGPDEFVDINELVTVAKIHTLTALKFLAPTSN
jgi:succinyl-diaminopimelate desuccinylase